MLNQIVLMGRLTRDPELRRTGSGVPVASFTIAVDRDYSGKDGGEKETDFIEIVAWRNTAEFVSKYFSKGRMAVIHGRLQIRNWTDKDGNKRKSAEVVADQVYFGDSKKEGDNTNNGYGQNYLSDWTDIRIPQRINWYAPTDTSDEMAPPAGGEDACAALADAFRAGRIYPQLRMLTVRTYPQEAIPWLESAGFIREMRDYVLSRN